MQHFNALWDPGIWCSHLPKILSLELEFYRTQVLLHSGNTDDREWELQRLKLPDLHIRPKPNARKRWLTCKSVQLKSRGRTHRESLESPSQLPIHWHLWMLPRWKSPTQTRTNIIWGESVAQFISTNSTNHGLKVQKSWTKACNANSTGDSSPQSMNSSPKKFGWWKGRGWSHPKALLAHIFRCFLNFTFTFPLNFAPQSIRNK